MSEEAKAKLEAEQAEEETTEVEAEAKDDETTEGEEQSEPDEESKQLEAELQREREARERAEKLLAQDAYKFRDKKRKVEPQVEDTETKETEEDPEEDRPMTRKEIQAALAKEREATRKEFQSKEADRLADALSGTETEKQLTLEKWKVLSFPEHISLEEQIESCYAVANRKKLIGQRQEALRALKGKEGVSRDSSNTHHDAPKGSQPKLAPQDNAEYARVGFKYNNTARRWEKKLPNGQLLVKTKSGQTQLVKA